MNTGNILIFIILAFTLSIVLILKRDSIAPPFKRWMALFAVIMMCVAFFLIIFSLLGMGA
ncbi:hypothetical protein Q5741_06275 [Paenibacillus sp. JX-17]|uniref:Signal transduction histidine kinase n=1 Tax=Paenibacillus lacisoli TaxID=3064525 RepID=A0ABT9CBI7_9BACL|nr:hypothetical protein [Paenibacillus sp. JX-17]MDO7906024.1 hypothetical protein [Paenibacillus sp. JX-17]